MVSSNSPVPARKATSARAKWAHSCSRQVFRSDLYRAMSAKTSQSTPRKRSQSTTTVGDWTTGCRRVRPVSSAKVACSGRAKMVPTASATPRIWTVTPVRPSRMSPSRGPERARLSTYSASRLNGMTSSRTGFRTASKQSRGVRTVPRVFRPSTAYLASARGRGVWWRMYRVPVCTGYRFERNMA